MPGIFGIIGRRMSEESQRLAASMGRCMEHETSYISGTYFVPEMGIYAGWLAHENSFAADQVFFNESKDISLVFSGECFPKTETRNELRGKGHWVGENPGDWLVHLYEDQGDEFFEKLNGLFSGLLIDRRQNKAFLFNDRYGVQRIYWCETKDCFYFASEAKALLRILPELRAFDREGVAQFLTFGCTLNGRTLFQDVQLFPGGSVWCFNNGKCRKRRYFSPATWETQPSLSLDCFQAEFQATFKRILPRYFESRSKVGISLTAGLDSRMIMACRPETSQKPLCYTFSGEKRETLDARLAGKVAAVCGLQHEILRLGRDFFRDFSSHADRTVYVTDGCLGILGAHEIYLNGQARRLAPLRVTGVFGGEILRGVSVFKPLGLSPRLVKSDLAQRLSSFAQEWKRDSEHPLTFAAFREIPQKRFGIPAASRTQLSFRTPYLDNEIVALAYQAPESFRASAFPAWSLIEENNRALIDIPTDMGEMGKSSGLAAASRRIFSKAACKLDYLDNEGLPHWLSPVGHLLDRIDFSASLFGRHKFLHYRRWFTRELAEYVSGILKATQTRCSPFWNSSFVEGMADEHINGRKNYVLEIDAVLTLEAVERLLFHNLPREPEPTVPAISGAALAPS